MDAFRFLLASNGHLVDHLDADVQSWQKGPFTCAEAQSEEPRIFESDGVGGVSSETQAINEPECFLQRKNDASRLCSKLTVKLETSRNRDS